jgi:hypothetical protein
MQIPADRVDAIRKGEEGLARRIALRYRVTLPVNVAAAMIPGKFIYDFLVRMREIRWSRDRYMPVRERALELAQRSELEAELGDMPGERLASLLAVHYRALLSVDGVLYGDLLKKAYPRAIDLEATWEEIAHAEKALDQVAVANRPEDAKLAARLEGHRRAAADQRKKLVQELYYE